MLARKSKLKHRGSGLMVETPLLVPAFSSKGFKLRQTKKGTKGVNFFQTKRVLRRETNPTSGFVSEVTEALRASAQVLTECMLVSAYDIFHRHIPLPYSLVSPDITFVDSGGYEKEEEHDFSAVFRSSFAMNDWSSELLKEVLDSWPEYVPAVFVSNDQACRGKRLAEQVEEARELFGKYRKQHLCALLIKPVKDELTFKGTLAEIFNSIEDLSDFDVVAVAEKDLGNSVLLNMENIAKIRLALDDAGIGVPIHIFGSLDPLSACLYFLAGAEIFDGLTWLRYAYFEGMAIYYRNYGMVTFGVHERDDIVRISTLMRNIYYLRDLQEDMKVFIGDGDFSKFRHNGELLRRAWDRLKTKFERRKI